jgi:hypothetical protein
MMKRFIAGLACVLEPGTTLARALSRASQSAINGSVYSVSAGSVCEVME